MMANRSRGPSPFLQAATIMMGSVETPFLGDSKFRHTFEAEVAKVKPDPDQPRRYFDEADLEQLAATLRSQGQLQPILVTQHPDQQNEWLIVAGERRWRAAQLNKWEKILAIEHLGDRAAAALIENLQRSNLSTIEMAQGINRLMVERSWTQVVAATELGMTQSRISGLIRVLTLPSNLLESEAGSKLTENVLVELARKVPGAERDKLIQEAIEGKPVTIQKIRKLNDPQKQEVVQRNDHVRQNLNLAGLNKTLVNLESMRSHGNSVIEEERDTLLRLRAVIDLLLGT